MIGVDQATGPPDPTPQSPERSRRAAIARRVQGQLATRYRIVPVLVVLAAIWILFGILTPAFLTSTNLSSLTLQIVVVAVLALALAQVLIVAEIDFAVAASSAVSAAIFGQLAVQHNVSPILAIVAAVASGAVIGAFQGAIVTLFEVPSFIITLGGSFVLQGLLLIVLPAATEQVTLSTFSFANIATDYLGPVPSLALLAGATGLLIYNRRHTHASKRRHGLQTSLWTDVAVPVGLLVAAGIAMVVVLDGDQGVPLLLVITLVLYSVVAFVMAKTRFGLHMYAVGGDPRAAQRAGINVRRVKTVAFAACNGLAAVAGILAATRVLSIGVQSASTDLLLQAAAACIIGGISLFGGRGSPWCAFAGALVIGSVENGLLLLAAPQQTQYIAEGGLLVGAILLDRIIAGAPAQ
jgi:D-xylose transport system permease protein